MQPFSYLRPADLAGAAVAAAAPGARFVAGGTNLLDLLKDDVETAALLIDLNALPLSGIEVTDRELRFGALTTMSDLAAHPAVGARWPAIAQALRKSASPQLRNMATLGGNLLQRTRCDYFRDLAFPCNKRRPGAGCAALLGENRKHAVLGTSEQCIATHASDVAVALVALDAAVHLTGRDGERTVPLADFHLLPGETPERETVLARGELIAAVSVPASAAAARSRYVKVRDRASYEFALAAAAVGLDVESGTIVAARVALGGVATRPWRSPAAEEVLIGRPAGEDAFAAAAAAALAGARPRQHNGYKIELARRTLVRALTLAAEGAAE